MLAKGIHHALRLVDRLVEGVVPDIPPLAGKIVVALAEQIRELQDGIAMLDEEIKTWFRGNELARRLETIPGIGVITVSALAGSVLTTSAGALRIAAGQSPLTRPFGRTPICA